MSLPGFKGNHRRLDALKAGPDHVGHSSSSYRCRPRPNKGDDLYTKSEYHSSWSGELVLSTSWRLSEALQPRYCSSRSELRGFLRDLDINLCPHRRLDDPWIAEILYRMAHPGERLSDPVDQWEADAKIAVGTGGLYDSTRPTAKIVLPAI